MNTRNAFHGLDENLQALAMPITTTTTSAASTASVASTATSNLQKSETSKKPSFASRSKSLLEEDDYFKVNLPPTYDMQPQRPQLSEDESTVLGLMNDKCSKGYENMVKDLSRAMQTPEEPTNLVTPYR